MTPFLTKGGLDSSFLRSFYISFPCVGSKSPIRRQFVKHAEIIEFVTMLQAVVSHINALSGCVCMSFILFSRVAVDIGEK